MSRLQFINNTLEVVRKNENMKLKLNGFYEIWDDIMYYKIVVKIIEITTDDVVFADHRLAPDERVLVRLSKEDFRRRITNK